MDLSKLKPGDYVIGGSALVLLIAVLLPWYSFNTPFGSESRNGLDYFFTGVVPLLLALAVVAGLAVIQLTDLDLPTLPVPTSLIFVVGSAVVAFLVFVRFLIGDGVAFVTLDRSYGLFLALLAAFAMLGGSVLKLISEGGLDELKGGSASTAYPPNPAAPQGPYGGPAPGQGPPPQGPPPQGPPPQGPPPGQAPPPQGPPPQGPPPQGPPPQGPPPQGPQAF